MKNIPKNNNEIQIQNNYQKKTRKSIGFSRTYPAFIILLISLVISYFVFTSFKKNIENQRLLEFNKAIQSISTRVENLKQTEIGILYSMRGLYDILPQVTKDYFEIYGTVPLETYKSISSISFIIPLKNSVKSTYIFDQYAIGYYYYVIRPEGDRDEYDVVQMMVPFANYDEHFLGYDIKTVPEISRAYELAKETGKMVCSDFIKFPIHENKLTTFIISPVYSQNKDSISETNKINNFQGALALEINLKEFFQEALRGGSALNRASFPSDSGIVFDVYEVNSAGKKVKCFASANRNLNYDISKSELHSTVDFYLVDKKIEFEFFSNTINGGKQQAYLPWLILTLSLILSMILFGFIYSVISNHAKLEQIALKVLQSQQSILDHTQELIVSIDYKSHLKVINNVFRSIFMLSEDSNNIKFTDFLFDDKSRLEFEELLQNSNKIQSKDLILKMKLQNDKEVDVSWTLIFFEDDHQINMIGRLV